MSMSNKQPTLFVKPREVSWANLDQYRLVLAKYKGSDLVTTLMRTGSHLFIMYSQSKIEPVTNLDWVRINLDFVRYYEPADKLELSGS